jgi:uncharacterized protein
VIFVEAGIVDLGHLALSHGQARRLDLDVDLQRVALGGQTYEIEGGLARARLDVSRTSTGHALRLRLTPELSGPCVRCLEDARLPLEIDVREVDQPSAGDEELRSPYVDEGQLDLERWANDAVVLALPAQPLCRSDCAGLCPVCGESLNDADPEAHHHETGGDPRFAKLKELKLDE